MIKRCLTSLVVTLIVYFLAYSLASARVCFLPDSTDCGEGDVVGGGNVEVPCQHSTCPAYNSNYQECYDERTYNNGGVNVTCKQIRCKLSKSECEEQAKATSHSCKFDDASGCYYLGECKQCNRDVYDLKEPKSGSDWECTSCTGCDGTFYNCTPINKECSDINSNYSTSCSNSQIAKEVDGIKDSHGNQCYTCESKPVGCTYEYRQVTTEDSAGVSGNLDDGYKCVNGSECWKKLYYVKSIIARTGTPAVMPIYNKISNKSATCVDENNVTKYEKICEGTPKSECNTSGYEFTPNGCVSNTYNNGFEVKGDEFGSCTKKEEKCLYEYTQLTKNDTGGVTDIGGSTLRYGKNDDKCYSQGSTRNKTSTCAGYNGGNGYRCGGTSDGPVCTNPGGSCTMKQTCQSYANCPDYSSCGIKDNPSIQGTYAGSHWETPYNKISNTSASCTTLKGVTKFETICEGTPKPKCRSPRKFTPNGCVSDDYSNGVNVLGTEWGNCACDTSNQMYDTIEECRSGTNSGCMAASTGSCYQTCESKGYYSSEEACKNTDYLVTCYKTDDCYNRVMQGFLIKYETGEKRRWNCSPRNANSYQTETSAFLTDVDKSYGSEVSGKYSQTVDGNTPQALPDDTTKGYQYKSGTYFLCYRTSGNSGIGLGVRSVQILKQSDYNAEFHYDLCFSGNPSSAGNWGGKSCEAVDYNGGNYACKKVTFTAGKIYKIRFDYNYAKEGWTYDMGTCNQY